MKDERLVSKMKGITNFLRRLQRFDGLTWLIPTPPPLFYDRSMPLGCGVKAECVWLGRWHVC